MRRKGILLFLICILTCMLQACGLRESHEMTDQGMHALENLDYETALACFDEAIANGENGQLSYRGQGIAYIGLADYENAATAFEQALSCAGGLASDVVYDTDYYLAFAYYKSGRIDDAIQIYNAILALRSDEKNAYFLRGKLELEQGNFELANADFGKALAFDEEDYDCILSIYNCLNDCGYHDEGTAYLQDAIARGEESMSDYDRGRLCYYLNDFETAKNCLERARDSGSAESVLFLGRTYEALGDYNYASSVYADYIEKSGDSGEIYNQLGICRLKMEDYENALLAFQIGMGAVNEPCLQNLKFNEIVAYEYMGDFKKADVLMETYLKNYPDDEKAQREWRFLRTR